VLHHQMIHNLVKSSPKRLELSLDHKGGYIGNLINSSQSVPGPSDYIRPPDRIVIPHMIKITQVLDRVLIFCRVIRICRAEGPPVCDASGFTVEIKNTPGYVSKGMRPKQIMVRGRSHVQEGRNVGLVVVIQEMSQPAQEHKPGTGKSRGPSPLARWTFGSTSTL
jgi:hypothetical protein